MKKLYLQLTELSIYLNFKIDDRDLLVNEMFPKDMARSLLIMFVYRATSL